MKKSILLLTVLLTVLLLITSCKCKHNYAESTVSPSCLTDGYTIHTCKKCGNSYRDRTTLKTGHTYVESVEAPTCISEGYTTYTCKICGDSYRDRTTPTIGHTYVESVEAPTCISEGYTTYTCKICGDSYRDGTTPKIGHIYVESVEAPICTSEGYTKHTCTFCGDSYNDAPTDKITHYFVGEACPNCGMEEITENITPNTEWYDAQFAIFDITTPEQLAGLASLVNSGTDFSGVKIYLDTDIDLGFYEWIPIGNATYAFNGSFDGDGHTISGLKINAGTDYVGLFGNVSGKICNFNIEKANIYVKRDHNYVSIACGYSTGDIKNISTDGFIEAPKSNYVGAVAGAVAPASTEYTNLTNKASINAQTCVGGIVGHINASGNFQTNYISNTGSVKGISQVGGIFGYVNGASGSLVSGASVSADIVGDYYVGGIVGKADNVAISTCTNDGSTVTSSSYYTEGSSYYVWLGGIVGYGYSVTNCTNNVDITYNAKGSYVGGIAGYTISDINDCTNNGDITTNTSCVGGIAGAINSTSARNISKLTNTGSVSGSSRVGGVIGSLKIVVSQQGTFVKKETKKKSSGNYSSYHRYNSYSYLSDMFNYGNVSAEDLYVGGIIGYTYSESTYYKETWDCCETNKSYDYYTGPCEYHGHHNISFKNIKNTGMISGSGNIGEVVGYFHTDGVASVPSLITNYTVLGKITVNGELLEGTYDFGPKTSITLSGREIYTEENTEATE